MIVIVVVVVVVSEARPPAIPREVRVRAVVLVARARSVAAAEESALRLLAVALACGPVLVQVAHQVLLAVDVGAQRRRRHFAPKLPQQHRRRLLRCLDVQRALQPLGTHPRGCPQQRVEALADLPVVPKHERLDAAHVLQRLLHRSFGVCRGPVEALVDVVSFVDVLTRQTARAPLQIVRKSYGC